MCQVWYNARMKAEDVDKMEAGHELDKLVAELVMGCTVRVGDGGWYYCSCPEIKHKPPHGDRKARRPIVGAIKEYSENIKAAWQVVETMSAIGFDMTISTCNDGDGYHCRIATDAGTPSFWREIADEVEDTVPLAICRAALKAHLAAQEPDMFANAERHTEAMRQEFNREVVEHPNAQEPPSFAEIGQGIAEWLQSPNPAIQHLKKPQEPEGAGK